MREPVPANAQAATLPVSAARSAASSRRTVSGAIWLEALPLLVFAVCTVVLFRDGLFGDTVFYERDTELFYQPLVRWYVDQIHAGHLPLWIPLIFGGYPLFADGELGMLYPFTVILAP